jgi:hydroxymethylglutaryl-CoA reductase
MGARHQLPITNYQLHPLTGAGLALSLDRADHMIENAVAVFGLPLGVADGFVVNGRDVAVPMVVDDPAIVAACVAVARLVRAGGGFTAGSSAPIMIGQIQVLDVPELPAARRRVEDSAAEWLDWLNTQNPSTVSRHARAVGLETRELAIANLAAQDRNLQSLISSLPASSGTMLILHLLYDCGDAMGANLINTACEALVPRVEMATGGRVNLRILSNLSDRRTAWARCAIPANLFEESVSIQNPKSTLRVQNLLEAARFAEVDPHFAATLNSHVMTGVDAVVMATGNDWRAVEAGAHAYAARSGRYSTLAQWRLNERGDLAGELELPLAVGTIGGATRVHPAAQAALKLIGLQTARELSEIAACAGLATSLSLLISNPKSLISSILL